MGVLRRGESTLLLAMLPQRAGQVEARACQGQGIGLAALVDPQRPTEPLDGLGGVADQKIELGDARKAEPELRVVLGKHLAPDLQCALQMLTGLLQLAGQSEASAEVVQNACV